MFGLEMLRRKLEYEARESLFDHEGEILLLEKNGEETTLVRTKIWRRRYFFRVMPLYHIFAVGDKLSFNDLVRPIREIAASLQKVIGNFPRASWMTVVLRMSQRFYSDLDAIKKDATAKIAASFAALHEKFLVDLIRKDRNAFRQNLAAVIRTTAAEALAQGVKQHLAMLIAKMREQRDSQERYISFGSHALPSGTKFAYQRDSISLFVIEQIPQVRTISYRGSPYRVSLPYVIFAVTLNNGEFICLNVFFRNAPLRSESDKLFYPALPNIHDDCHVCFPRPKGKGTPALMVEEAIQNFWGSNFNNDLPGYLKAAQEAIPQLCSFQEWERQSGRDPQMALKIAWQPLTWNVGRAVEHILNFARGRLGEQKRSGIDAFQEYADALGQKFSSEIVEKLHFMASHAKIDVDSLALANQEFERLMASTAERLRVQVNRIFTTPISAEELDAICDELQGRLLKEIENVHARPVEEVTQKLQQL